MTAVVGTGQSGVTGEVHMSDRSGPAMAETSNVVSVVFDLPRKVWEALAQMADRDHVPRVEMLRRAISLMRFYRRVLQRGSQLVVLHSDGEMQEVTFRWDSEVSREPDS